jgi:hypothetical protein
MTTIKANVPDYLAKLAVEAAEKEKITLDQVVSLALSAQVSAWRVRDDIETRAKRANLEAFDRILERVPNVPPQPGDEL